MKSTGIVRKVDPLDRVVIPKELCRTLGIEPETPIEFFTEGENIILRKYQRGCVFCGETKDLKPFGNKEVCGNCRQAIKAGLK